ncbi:hypothetical protein [Falsirhodobacter sp. 20TX0035]|uniref:hypothetical protein n=1 Tax=Falsirhodobacter sp. 20TX0035 TaxID=3022019 RepID=UPI0023304235|nr:hypothetical protein [Falsirhodobacter sp. 20TX0035]MDB6454695.1 hypothetical protein [Falsirhodobacter sp. 20TX0035]
MAAKDDTKTEVKADAAPMTGVKLIPMRVGNEMKPHARLKGEAPRKGSKLAFTLADGVTYTGKVLAVTDLDGDVLVEFDGPLTY